MNPLTEILLSYKDEKFKEFNAKIVHGTKYEMIGVKTPVIKEIIKNATAEELDRLFSHKPVYYEEVMLMGLAINRFKDLDREYALINEFLPLIDNWAVCDATVASLKRIRKDKERLFEFAKSLTSSDKTFYVRFGVVILFSTFCSEEYADEVLGIYKSIKSEDYYVNMAIAWGLSVFLVKFYDKTSAVLKSGDFSPFVIQKTISKANDSFRISAENKYKLKQLLR